MISINTPTDCCGCSACKNICPKCCIEMVKDEEGFFYPSVDSERCINCNLCERVCPIKNDLSGQDLGIVYAVRNQNDDVVDKSAAGGAFTAIAKRIICQDGLVVGAKYSKDMKVKHFIAESISEAVPFRGYKYVQSDLGDIFWEVRKKLDAGKTVCFSGTPCQVAGLKGFLRKDYSNLICVDVVCKGVATPLILEKFIEQCEDKYKSSVVNLSFRTKDYGYHMSTTKVEFASGKSILSSGEYNSMMGPFIQNLCLRPSCHVCRFKGRKRLSDITIFDCWSFKKVTGKPDDDRGYTSFWIHSEKGKALFDSIKDCFYVTEMELDSIVRADGHMVEKSIPANPKRKDYFESLINYGLEDASKYVKTNYKAKGKDRVKRLLYTLGLYRYNK